MAKTRWISLISKGNGTIDHENALQQIALPVTHKSTDARDRSGSTCRRASKRLLDNRWSLVCFAGTSTYLCPRYFSHSEKLNYTVLPDILLEAARKSCIAITNSTGSTIGWTAKRVRTIKNNVG